MGSHLPVVLASLGDLARRLRVRALADEPALRLDRLVLGTAVGVLPGLGSAMAVALLLPVTFTLDPVGRSSCSPASTTAACSATRRPPS